MKRIAVLVPTLALLLAACGIVGPDGSGLRQEIADHRAVWEATRPFAYAYVVARQCFCPTEAIGPVRVRVQGDSVTSRTYVDGGAPVSSEFTDLFPDVDGLFDVLTDALDQGADTVTVDWADQGGVPREIFIDRYLNAADDEVWYQVVEAPVADTAG